ncbi:MAG TPA: glycosyltransferase [Anaerolineales bacterium]|nr:glycosyltransferase [Anaerolineales bacterium]HNC08792.1 glycosyltransferase [Anaerolineales bacterium]
MRIGMMVDSYKPYISGITNYVEVNKEYLEKAGHEVFVFTFGDVDYKDNEPNIIRNPGVPLADTGFYLSMRYSRNAKNILQTMDVVHVHHPFLSGRLALRYCRPLKIPIVFTNHSRYDLYAQAYLPMMPDEVSTGLLQAYLPSFCDAVDLVITPSPGMEKVLRQLNVTSKIEIIPNGVDLSAFQTATPFSREELGYSENDILIVYAGRIALEKSIPFLIESFSGIAKAIPNTYLLIIGGGIQQYEEEIRKKIQESELENRVHMTGRVPYDQLPAYLAMCDIFATASVTEVHPLSVIESMGAGLPVMGIESVGVGDTVVDGVTGFLATNDLPAFTAKLTRLCLDPDLRAQMSRSAREASTAYAIRRTTQMMLKQYERLVHESRPGKASLRTRLRGIMERFLS